MRATGEGKARSQKQSIVWDGLVISTVHSGSERDPHSSVDCVHLGLTAGSGISWGP